MSSTRTKHDQQAVWRVESHNTFCLKHSDVDVYQHLIVLQCQLLTRAFSQFTEFQWRADSGLRTAIRQPCQRVDDITGI